MSDYIRDAIEAVRRKALISKARMEREREIARVASGASFEDAQPVSSGDSVRGTAAIRDDALAEFERIERLTAAALRDYVAVYGGGEGEEAAG